MGKSIKWVMLFGVLAAAAWGGRSFAAPPTHFESLRWQLGDAEVLQAGEITTAPEGTYLRGYVVRLTARTETGAPLVPRGTFTVTASGFQPAVDMPGQMAGVWYMRGEWTLVKSGAAPNERAARHNPWTMKGILTAELTFNPAVEAGQLQAAVRLPMAPAAGVWARGQGAFLGNEKFEGTLTMAARFWPDVFAAAGGQP